MTGPGEMLGSQKNRSRYHLRVQEGCENSCTFCIIPQTRGRFSSRSLEDVLTDLVKISDLGYEEIILTGTHLGGYGIDIGTDFFTLLREVVKAKPSARIRLSSIDPNDVSFEMADFLLENKEVFCSHLHVCIQAFCERTLKRMNRLHTLEESVNLVNYIHKKEPRWCIGSDLIAGFPGETREEFDESLKLFESLPISYLHVFPYSERQNTAAVNLDGSVNVDERRRRSARFRASAERKRVEFITSLLGEKLEVILEQGGEEWIKGTSREYASVRIKPSDNLKLTKRILLKAKAVDSLKGELVCEQ